MTLAWLPCDRHPPVINDAVPANSYGLPAGAAIDDLIWTGPTRIALSALLDECRVCMAATVDAMMTLPEQVVYAVVTSALTAQADTGRSVLDLYRPRIPIARAYLTTEAAARILRGDDLMNCLVAMSFKNRSEAVRTALAILAACLDEGKPIAWYPPAVA